MKAFHVLLMSISDGMACSLFLSSSWGWSWDSPVAIPFSEDEWVSVPQGEEERGKRGVRIPSHPGP